MSSQPLGKLVERALRKAVHRQVSHTDKRARLEAVMDKTVELAMEGEQWAVQFIGDRLDGKAKQQLELEISNRMTIVIGQGDHSGEETTVDAAPILDVDQDGTVPALASRGIDTETTLLPPPDAYEVQKILQSQRSSSDPRVDAQFDIAATERVAHLQRLSRVRAALGAPIVPVDGVIGDAEHAERVPASPYACVYAATGQQTAPCAVCQRMPACPRRVGDAVAP